MNKDLATKILKVLKKQKRAINIQKLGKLTGQQVIIKDVTNELRDTLWSLVDRGEIEFDKKWDITLPVEEKCGCTGFDHHFDCVFHKPCL